MLRAQQPINDDDDDDDDEIGTQCPLQIQLVHCTGWTKKTGALFYTPKLHQILTDFRTYFTV